MDVSTLREMLYSALFKPEKCRVYDYARKILEQWRNDYNYNRPLKFKGVNPRRIHKTTKTYQNTNRLTSKLGIKKGQGQVKMLLLCWSMWKLHAWFLVKLDGLGDQAPLLPVISLSAACSTLRYLKKIRF